MIITNKVKKLNSKIIIFNVFLLFDYNLKKIKNYNYIKLKFKLSFMRINT